MIVLCLGALLAGLAAAPVIPFPPFACAVLVSAAVGCIWAVAGDVAGGRAALSVVVLIVACQIGYGVGLLSTALVGQARANRRSSADRRAAARPLRTGNGPR